MTALAKIEAPSREDRQNHGLLTLEQSLALDGNTAMGLYAAHLNKYMLQVFDILGLAHMDIESAQGVEITQEPVERYGTVDAGFRDPSGNGWKVIQERR